jgi:RNA polymerase sigma-70 factor (ECF subfamily)
MEDTDLVRLCQNGDIPAFDELFHKYRDKIYSTAYRMINNQEDALDLTQEIFLKVYQKIGKYDFKSTFSTWLYRLAMNVCIDELRKRKKVNLVPLSQDYADEKTPADNVISKEEEDLIWEALNSLKEKERAILVLRDVEGLPYDEIAKILKCSLGRVKSRIHESREKLKMALERSMKLRISS